MGELIRLLIVALLIWCGWRWLTRSARLDNSTPMHASTTPKRMVKCAQCALHLPDTEAFHYRDLHFCSQSHQAAFLAQHTHDAQREGRE